MNTTRYERRRYAVVRASVWTSSWRIAAASARRSSVVCKGSPCRGRGSRIVAIAASWSGRANLREWANAVHRDLHRRPETLAAQLDVRVVEGLAARADDVRPDDLVPELARDAERLRVALDRTRPRHRGA